MSSPKKSHLSKNPREFSSVAEMVRNLAEDKEAGKAVAKEIEERNIVNFLIGLRTARGLSQADVASAMGCTQSKVSKLESGADDSLSLGDFDAYARSLGLELTIYLGKRKRSSLVQRITMHLNAIGKLMAQLAEFANHQDGKIKNGASKALFSNVVRLLNVAIDSIKAALPAAPTVSEKDRERITIQSDLDCDDGEIEVAPVVDADTPVVRDREPIVC